MSSTTMHFGPEWMRTKTPTRAQPPPSPPPGPNSGASTYSALVSPAPPIQLEERDEAHPFRYSKEELLQIYRDGGGRGGLGLEVERWEGVVREIGSQPIGLREMNEAEKKLFQGPLNSDLRRRQSTDYLTPLSTHTSGNDRPRLGLSSPVAVAANPMKDRFATLRRRDSADQPSLVIPRKQSFSSLQPTSPRDVAPSPRRTSGFVSGFDGILGGTDSWVARRRASEASMKASTSLPKEGGQDYQLDSKASGIREEEENVGREPDENPTMESHLKFSASARDSVKDNLASYNAEPGAEMTRLSLDDNNPTIPESTTTHTEARLPVTNTDITSVEWSYKDPSGRIQGPFSAELMQKWFDERYFADDLPVKRSHLDTQWITVEELVRNHGGSKIFVTPPVLVVPPGLTHRDSQNFTRDPLLFNNSPYQPAPVRNLRSSTLDTFGSNASDSPSSSFGAARFGNVSPDANAFGGRAVFGDSSKAHQNFAAVPDTAAFNRRNNFNDSPLDVSPSMRNPAFGSIVPGGIPSMDSIGFNRTYSPGQPWSTAPFDSTTTNRVGTDTFPTSFGSSAPPNNFGNLGTQQDVFNDAGSFKNAEYNPYSNGLPQPLQPLHYSTSPAPPFQLPSSNAYVLQNAPQTISDVNSSPALSQSPWNTDAPTSRRTGPIDAVHLTSTSTNIIQPVADVSPWGQTNQPLRPSTQANEPSPWLLSSQGLVDDNWKVTPIPDSLTFDNVGQHNQQQQQLVNETSTTIDNTDSPEVPAIHPIVDTFLVPDSTTKVAQAKSKAKLGAQASRPAPTLKATTIQQQVISEQPVPPSPAVAKAAWMREDESKLLGSSVSLREIQEAEAKKSEARKAVEREKERATRGAAPAPEIKDAAQAFTASWGLPTSQAGARATSTAIPAKEPITTPSPTSTPVWTSGAKSVIAKKSMKEIQEEEEKRKKNAAKESIASTVRRNYTDVTQKANPTVSSSNAWTTVGPNGKPTASATPARPIATTSTSNLVVHTPVRSNGGVAPRPAAASPVTPKPVPKSDDPVPPSHEFVKWLSGSLKGLNSSVNIEEIMQMLLSFSIDPDPPTIELISDLIYANSTTLDGRRFAAEYVSKRKADAASRPKVNAAAGKTTAKPVSIADVVKAAPKPSQPEWGFKVVNKKKKGSRA